MEGLSITVPYFNLGELGYAIEGAIHRCAAFYEARRAKCGTLQEKKKTSSLWESLMCCDFLGGCFLLT